MKSKGVFNRLVIIMNPTRVVHSDRVNVSGMDTVHIALAKLKSLFAQIGIGEYYPYLKLSRVDYAIDIFLEAQELVEVYIALLKRGDIPNNFTPRTWYDTTSHRTVTYKDSLYYEMLRLEVQWKRPKIHYMVKRHGLQDLPHEFLNEQVAVASIKEYLSKVSMLGDYYCLPKAKVLILHSALRDRHKDEVISLRMKVI